MARMEYQKITNLLNKTNDQPSKFRTRKCVEVNDYTNNGKDNPDSLIRFNTTMLKSSLCDYSDTYILVEGTIKIVRDGADEPVQRVHKRNNQLTFKNCSPFTNFFSQMDHT